MLIKPDGSIHVCLDPKDLNVAIKREHYPLLLIDDITANCAGATVFSTSKGILPNPVR